MKSVVIDNNLVPAAAANRGGESQAEQAPKVQEWVLAAVLIAIPLVILAWMSHANSVDADVEKTMAYVAAGVVLLSSCIVGTRTEEKA